MLHSNRAIHRCMFREKTLRALSTTAQRMNHLDRTASNTREPGSFACRVSQLDDLSPTVKKLSLEVKTANVTFKAGQWVDFFIPGVSVVGGFSICSSPSLLRDKNTIDLAVKKSNHPPAAWVHTDCKVGSEVTARVGGDFFLDNENVRRPLLLLAGGVGINPLLSMLLFASEVSREANPPAPVLLLYSVRTQEELIFVDQIQAVIEKCPWIHLKLFVTREEGVEGVASFKRIDQHVIEQCLEDSFVGQKDKLLSYLCGPSPFLDSMELYLTKCGVDKRNILYEKWW